MISKKGDGSQVKESTDSSTTLEDDDVKGKSLYVFSVSIYIDTLETLEKIWRGNPTYIEFIAKAILQLSVLKIPNHIKIKCHRARPVSFQIDNSQFVYVLN